RRGGIDGRAQPPLPTSPPSGGEEEDLRSKSMQAEQTSFLFGANAPFIEELYARFLEDPSRVDDDWRTFFEALAEQKGDVLAEVRGASWAPNGARVIDVPDTEMPRAAANRNVKANGGAAMPLAGQGE